MSQTAAPQLIDGAEYVGRPVNPEYGNIPGSGKKEIRLMMEILEGPLAGRRVKYTANTKDERSTAFAKRDLKAAGWQGASIKTFVADVTKMGESGAKIPFTVRLARNTKEDGTVSEWWTVGTIGVASIPLSAPTADDDALVDSWFGAVDDQQPAPRQQGQGQPTGVQRSTGNAHPNAPGNGPAPF